MADIAPATGPLHGYELAFLKAGGVLVRDDGRRLVLMWLCRKGGADEQQP